VEEKSMKRNVSLKPIAVQPAVPEPSAEAQSFIGSLFSSFSNTRAPESPTTPRGMTRTSSDLIPESPKKSRGRSATTASPSATSFNPVTEIAKSGGFVTVFQPQYNVWKRRYFVFNGTQLQLYSTSGTVRLMDQVQLRDLSGVALVRTEIIVANSLKMDFGGGSSENRRRGGEPLLVYCDDRTALTKFMGKLQEVIHS
jgi:hypothetical protein